MAEATIEYKDSPNESTAYAVTGGQKNTVQLVATPAGDLQLSNSPNVDTGFLIINGQKHKVNLVHNLDGELELPKSSAANSGYVKTQDGKRHRVKLTANLTNGGGSGTTIRNQDKQITANGTYTADAGYTGLGTVNVNVPTSGGEKTKFGASVDDFLGGVDADGNYTAPREPFEVNLAGVKSVWGHGFSNRFSRSAITKFIADDLVSCDGYSFQNCLAFCNYLTEVSVANLETVNREYAFEGAFTGCPRLTKTKFAKLKIINANNAFDGCFSASSGMYSATPDEVFPALEEVKGLSALRLVFNEKSGRTYVFSKIKKITGETSIYSATLGTLFAQNTVWSFPSATEFTGYIWYVSSSSTVGEIHFAAANREAIEACDGYANKWGFVGATIFFDL